MSINYLVFLKQYHRYRKLYITIEKCEVGFNLETAFVVANTLCSNKEGYCCINYRTKLVDDLLDDFLANPPKELDYNWIHEIGSGCDDTELPHHVSSQAEIISLIESVHELLLSLPKPSLITIAR